MQQEKCELQKIASERRAAPRELQLAKLCQTKNCSGCAQRNPNRSVGSPRKKVPSEDGVKYHSGSRARSNRSAAALRAARASLLFLSTSI
jgi:hypothetical protein